MIDETTAERLRNLADKYEIISFTEQDPSQFLKWYKNSKTDSELAAFLAAMLAFGNRKQFIPKIEQILKTADDSSGSFSRWLLSGRYKIDFPYGDKKFYRFYSYDDMHIFFGEITDILNGTPDIGEKDSGEADCGALNSGKANCGALNSGEADCGALNSGEADCGALGEFFRDRWYKKIDTSGDLADIIAKCFPKSKLVPKGKTSACKRTYMFLRWMVRKNSPVDLGLWDWYSPQKLLIPLDTHVMQEAIKIGILDEKSTASRKTARILTNEMERIFPEDPVRADYALFGLGIDTER